MRKGEALPPPCFDMNFSLPKSLLVAGEDRLIRWEYRDVLTILSAMSDPELTPEDKALVALVIFYPEAGTIPREALPEAAEQMNRFIDGGQTPREQAGPRLMDWEQDFPWIIAPVNRVLGRDVREEVPLHWWTFLSAYYEIGDCLFAQIVRIREAMARGKKLDKADRAWARRNADLIKLETKYTQAESELLDAWTKGGPVNAGNG